MSFFDDGNADITVDRTGVPLGKGNWLMGLFSRR